MRRYVVRKLRHIIFFPLLVATILLFGGLWVASRLALVAFWAGYGPILLVVLIVTAPFAETGVVFDLMTGWIDVCLGRISDVVGTSISWAMQLYDPDEAMP